MPIDGLKHIGFDLDNTLINRDIALRGWAFELTERYPAIMGNRTADQVVGDIVFMDDHGYCPRNTFCRWIAETFPQLQMSHAAVWQDFCRRLPRFLGVDDLVCALIAALSDRFGLFIISNGSSLRQREKLACAGLTDRFPQVWISEEVGAQKPDPFIFRTAVKAFACHPEDILFIGDDPHRDIVGAGQVGLKTCWLTMNRRYPPDLPQPDWQIDKLDALFEIIL